MGQNVGASLRVLAATNSITKIQPRFLAQAITLASPTKPRDNSPTARSYF